MRFSILYFLRLGRILVAGINNFVRAAIAAIREDIIKKRA